MEANQQYPLKVGDWVRAKSSKGELIHGFVEKNTLDHQVIQLRVVASDNKMLMGHSIQMNQSKIDRLDDNFFKTENQLYQLIDIALETHDQAWFNELTNQLHTLQNQKQNGLLHANHKMVDRQQTDYRS